MYRVTGVNPSKIRIYREALKHSSTTKREDTDNVVDNERLEFLGDAILDAVVAELLFLRFPKKDEGFLTEMRTRIVNREQMGDMAHKLGLVEFMEVKHDLLGNKSAMKTIAGNALEALIGAIYLDKGYATAKSFIVKRMVAQYLDIDKLMLTTVSYKAVFMKWLQQQRKQISWEHEVDTSKRTTLHKVSMSIDGELWFVEENASRKKAEELCCEKACRRLDLTT
ncbi:MAG: ribonuclease III family protein [Bacteroidota bacterium]